MLAWIGLAVLAPAALLSGVLVALRGDGRAAAVSLGACGALSFLLALSGWGALIGGLLLAGAAGIWPLRQPSPPPALLRGAGMGGALLALTGLAIHTLGPLPAPSGSGPGAEAYLLLGAAVSAAGAAGALGREDGASVLPLLLLGAGAALGLAAQQSHPGAVGLSALVVAAAWSRRRG